MSQEGLYELEQIFDTIAEMLTDGGDIAYALSTIFGLLVNGGLLIFAVIGAIIGFLISVLFYVFHALPVFVLSRKAGRKLAWLAWVPFFPAYFRAFVLCDLAGEKEFSLFGGKIRVKKRNMSFLAYVGIGFFGSALITSLTLILSLIPGLGYLLSLVGSLLSWIPAICVAFMDYVYLRDALDLFKPDKTANNTASIVVTIIDALATFGFARTVWLYTAVKKDLLPPEQPETVVAQDVYVQ